MKQYINKDSENFLFNFMFVTWLYLWALWECLELKKKRKCQKKNLLDGIGLTDEGRLVMTDVWKFFRCLRVEKSLIESLNCSLCLRWVTFPAWLLMIHEFRVARLGLEASLVFRHCSFWWWRKYHRVGAQVAQVCDQK